MLVKTKASHQGAATFFFLFIALSLQWVAAESSLKQPVQQKQLSLGISNASREVKQLLSRILTTQNNENLPFVILDKTHARVFVFNSIGLSQGTAPALIGFAVGDDGVAGIGDRPLASIRREEKTTPAGRYVSSLDHNLAGNQILWVDYESAISLHSLVTGDPKEQRTKRLESQSIDDNRISFGCINVSATFFQNVVMPTFKDTLGIVYILPDSRAIQEVFSFYEP
jgi:hypothetical protein